MSNIYVTSDLHLCHDRTFVYGPRGFSSIQEMNEAIVERWNSKVRPRDRVFVLGDVMLNNNEEALKYIKQLNGTVFFYSGNHDTVTRIMLLSDLDNWTYCGIADIQKINGYHLYLSHYPTICSSIIDATPLKQRMINLHGHVHTTKKFIYDIPYIYNVCMDAHNCYPVSIDEIIQDMDNEVTECLKFLA